MTQSSADAGAIARACGFVEAYGSVLARERLDALLGVGAPGRVESVLAGWRCQDGGFSRLVVSPPLLPRGGSVAGALDVLGVLDELSIRRGPLAEGVAAWLAPAQGDDGAWRIAPSDALAPEDSDAVFVTAMLAGHLSKLGCGSPRTLERAEEFLATRFSPEGIEGGERGDWRCLTAFAHVCANGAGEFADEALPWCGRALEKSFRRGQLSALDAARVFVLADVRRLPGARIDATQVAAQLPAEQNADGSFGSGGSSRDRVETTLLAVRTLVRIGGKATAWTPA